MMNSNYLKYLTAVLLVSFLQVDISDAAVLRYRQSGDWNTITDGTGPGWGINPNNSGAPGTALPGTADEGRINFGNNTVTVTSAVPALNRLAIGVDESGNVEVNNGGVLTANQDILAGNNGTNATGTLIVNDGGVVNVGRILWSANNQSTGVIDINAGGQVNVASHLWWGVTGTATIDISGTLTQTGGILGLGTSNAVSPPASNPGSATVNILDGGLLALNNISGAAGTPSIQPGSVIDITGSGELTVPNDFVGVLGDYVAANKITADGGASVVTIDLTKNPGFTTAYIAAAPIPEPSSILLIGLGMCGLAARRR